MQTLANQRKHGARTLIRLTGLAGVTLTGLTACRDVTGSQPLPSGTADPASYNTAAGAMGQRNATLGIWNDALRGMIVTTGALTDELSLTCRDDETAFGNCRTPVDQRALPTESKTFTTANSVVAATDANYEALHTVRGLAVQAIGQLATYDPSAPSALRGELYAASGYAEILLADLFCSGVPLSTLDFHRDYTYAASSTTAQVYQDAVAKFDSALALAVDSSRILNLARVGKGRALLDLGEYAAAAQAVASVSDAFSYQVTVRWHDSSTTFYDALAIDRLQEADREGTNGLPFVSSSDPRTAAEIAPGLTRPTLEPTKVTRTMSAAGFVPVTVASGIEARLIEAEAALHANPTGTQWLTILNALRASGPPVMHVSPHTFVDTLGYTGCTFVGACNADGYQVNLDYTGLVLVSSTSIAIPDPDNGDPTAIINAVCRAFDPPNRTFVCYNPTVNVYTDPTRTDTTITSPVGTGGISGLPWLADPGASLTGTAAMTARIRLLFDERAYWLYLTAHRQGDLRRLLRQYRTSFPSETQVYPVGPYPGTGFYGGDITAPIPSAEYANPLFHGCLDRDA